MSTNMNVAEGTITEAAGQQLVQWDTPEPFNAQNMDPASFSFTATESGNSASVIFGDLQIELLDNNQSVMSAVQTGTLQIPVSITEEQKPGLKGYRCDIRLTVQKEAGIRIVLVADLGGTSQVFEFPYEQEVAEDTEFHYQVYSPERSGTAESGLAYRATGLFYVTFIVSVQRWMGCENGFARVNSLDIIPEFC